MRATLSRAARLLTAVYRVLFLLLATGFIALATCVYLAASGTNLTAMRWVVGTTGKLIAGQKTDRLSLRAEIAPEDGGLGAEATLTLRALDESRRRFFFLLNPKLDVNEIVIQDTNGALQPARVYHLWMIHAVELERPLAAGETAQLRIRYSGRPSSGLFGGEDGISSNDVFLGVDSFWYPADVNGFVTIDAHITAPAHLTVLNNGSNERVVARGSMRETSWSYDRPVAGLALVAGRYRSAERTSDGVTYRVRLAEDVDLDSDRILTHMEKARGTLTSSFGPSGFNQSTLFVSRRLRRAFNDGSGLIGTSIRYFRNGDYAFALIAHEIAHDWWGATVAEKWLTPASGGQWLVEGLATFSSWMAVEAEYGRSGMAQVIQRDLFDPERQQVISQMSAYDNFLREATARDTIYRKGGYAALMLRQVLGADALATGLRQFVERFRLQQATDRDLQTVLEETSGQQLGVYFDDWLRSRKLADLSIDKTPEGGWLLNNNGEAVIASPIEILTIPPNGEPIWSSAKVGDRLEIAPDAEVRLDPYLLWADPWRPNNRVPSRKDPIALAHSSQGWVLVTEGEPYPWSRTAITMRDRDGKQQANWEFQRGLLSNPVWSADGKRAAVAYDDGRALMPMTVLLRDDGQRRDLGRGEAPRFSADGALLIGRQDQLIAYGDDNQERVVARRPGWLLGTPVPAPSGPLLAYTATRDSRLEVRLFDRDTHTDVRLLAVDRGRVLLEWAADGSTVYAGLGREGDWQILALPLNQAPPRVLAANIVTLRDLARSPNGKYLAFSAAPEPTFPILRHLLFVLDLESQAVIPVDVPGRSLEDLDWADDQTILAVGAEQPPGLENISPATRRITRIDLRDQSQTDMP